MLDKLYLSVCSIFILKRLRHRGKTSRGCCSKVKPLSAILRKPLYITLGTRTCHWLLGHAMYFPAYIVARFFFTQSWKYAHSQTQSCWVLLTHCNHYMSISIVQISFAITITFFFKAVIILWVFKPPSGFSKEQI